FRIEQSLYLRQAERGRLGKSGVARALCSELSFEFLTRSLEVFNRGRQARCLPARILAAKQLGSSLGFAFELPPELSLAIEQIRVCPLANVGARFRERLEKDARARPLACTERQDIQAFVRVHLVKAHQHVDVEVVIGLHRSEVGGPEIGSENFGALRFSKREHGLDLGASLGKVPLVSLDPRNFMKRGRFPGAVSHLPRYRQRLLIELERAIRFTAGLVCRGNEIERGGFSRPIARLANSRQELRVMV